jgi:hypothetical protein
MTVARFLIDLIALLSMFVAIYVCSVFAYALQT